MKTSKTLLLGAAMLLNFTSLVVRSYAAPGDVDLSFDPGSGVNGEVLSIVAQPDGKALIAGQFTTVRGAIRKRIARLNPDGNVDFTFSPVGWDFGINSIALQPDGKVLMGGDPGIARLNGDGSYDTSFNSNAFTSGPEVNSVALQADGKILRGGKTSVFNQTGRIVRLNADGTLDTSFDASVNAGASEVFVVATQPDGKVLIGGLFTSINGAARNKLARLNADGSVDALFDPGARIIGEVRSIAVQSDGKVLVGGFITSVDGASWTGVTRLNEDGTSDPSFTPGAFNGSVYSITIQADGKLLLGGGFTSIGGIPQNSLARLNSNGSIDTPFKPGTDANGWVRSVAIQTDGTMFVGGSFVSMAGAARLQVARLKADASLDSTFDPGTFVNGAVRSLAAQADGKVLVAGDFTMINGAARNRIARLNADGTSDNSFDPGTGANRVVYCATVQSDGKALIGGAFTSVAGITRNGIARLNLNGSLDTAFNPSAGGGGFIVALASLPDGKTLGGGSFSSINGTARNSIARLNADGSLDTSFNPGAGPNPPYVYSIAMQADGKVLIGGEFTSFNGTARNRIARLNVNGSLDSTFNPGSGATDGSSGLFTAIYSVAVQPDGKLLVGGDFTRFNGVARNGLARLNANGSLDSSFNPGSAAGGGHYWPGVHSVIPQRDGKVLVGGDFTFFNGMPRDGIVRLNMNGSLDSSFNQGPGANEKIFSVAIQADGKILVGGEFSSVNGAPRPYVARLRADYLPSQLEMISAGDPSIVQLTGEVGQRYVLERAADVAGAWTSLPEITLTTSPQRIEDSAGGDSQRRFYRARIKE
jgi:uncharacterized delta-60 repeat protein